MWTAASAKSLEENERSMVVAVIVFVKEAAELIAGGKIKSNV